jgi:hypothetical protein
MREKLDMWTAFLHVFPYQSEVKKCIILQVGG